MSGSVRHRELFVEGPDDVGAIRELGTRFFGAQIPRPQTLGTKRASEDRTATVHISGGRTLKVVAARDGKSGLARMLENHLRARPPFTRRERRETQPGALGVLFDPDAESESKFHASINSPCVREVVASATAA
jgi:hypothetical protein